MSRALARRVFNGYPDLEMADIVQARLAEVLRLVAGKVQIAIGGGPHHCFQTHMVRGLLLNGIFERSGVFYAYRECGSCVNPIGA